MSEKLLGTCYKRFLPSQVNLKYFRMQKVYNVFKKLVNHTGFGWDFETNTPTCPDDVWKEYCKANPGASKFRHVGLPDYELNKNMFEKSNATGGLAYTSASQPCDLEDEWDMEDRFLNSGIPQFEGDEEAFQEYIMGQHFGDKRAGPSGGRGKGKKKRNSDAECVSTAMLEVASAKKARMSSHM
ncbi:hypothetical protein UlMin_019764 [Ulmus minor]